MKQFFLIAAAVFICASAHAQEEDSTETKAPEHAAKNFYHTPYRLRNSGSFDKRSMLLSLTYGFPNILFNGDYSGRTLFNNNSMGVGPITLRLEIPVRDEIGIQLFGQYAGKNWDNGSITEKATGIGGGALGMYHFNKLIPVPKLDIYAGVGVGLRHDDANFYNNYPDIIVDVIGVAGARYYFTHVFGIMAEGGYTGYSYASAGVTFRFTEKKMHHKKLANEAPRVSPGE